MEDKMKTTITLVLLLMLFACTKEQPEPQKICGWVYVNGVKTAILCPK